MMHGSHEEIADYCSQAREFLAKSRAYLAANDLHQASEKGWGAASHMAKAVAAAQGWAYDNHAGFNEVLYQAWQLSGNPRIHELRAVASELQANHYIRKRHLHADDIGASLDYIAELLELLAPLTGPESGG